jgi:hypothetical protein
MDIVYYDGFYGLLDLLMRLVDRGINVCQPPCCLAPLFQLQADPTFVFFPNIPVNTHNPMPWYWDEGFHSKFFRIAPANIKGSNFIFFSSSVHMRALFGPEGDTSKISVRISNLISANAAARSFLAYFRIHAECFEMLWFYAFIHVKA